MALSLGSEVNYTHLCLMPRLSICGAIPPLPPCFYGVHKDRFIFLFVGNTNCFDYHFVRLLRIDCILVGHAGDGRRSDRNLLVNSNI